MFKKYTFIGSPDSNDIYSRQQYQIIDDDFEDIGNIDYDPAGYMIDVINTYSKRNLPIAPNLIRAMIFYKDNYYSSLDEQFELFKKTSYCNSKLEKDIKKYLLFS